MFQYISSVHATTRHLLSVHSFIYSRWTPVQVVSDWLHTWCWTHTHTHRLDVGYIIYIYFNYFIINDGKLDLLENLLKQICFCKETYHGLFGVNLLWSSASNLLDDGSYVGWSVQLKFGETGLVGLNQPLNTYSSVKTESVASMDPMLHLRERWYTSTISSAFLKPIKHSPTHSGFSSLKFTAKSCETFRRGLS